MIVMLKFNLIASGILLLCSACAVHIVDPPPSTGDVNDKGILNYPNPNGFRTYTVQQGDTLYRIARTFGRSVSEIAQWNGLRYPYTIRRGDILFIEPPVQYPSNDLPNEIMSPSQTVTKKFYRGSQRTTIPPAPANNQSTQCYPPVLWQWPATYGSPEKTLSQTGNEGILIWGQIGQAIKAAASGKVTYSGGGHGGYPNLITIEHNNAFLSVYAFNRKRWVQENANVAAGQTIAEMGSDVSGRAVLLFEIRCHGKALDPLSYLPR